METSYDKRKEIAKALGLKEYLHFTTFTRIFKNEYVTEYKRVEIYSDIVEARERKKWSYDIFWVISSKESRDGWINSWYGND